MKDQIIKELTAIIAVLSKEMQTHSFAAGAAMSIHLKRESVKKVNELQDRINVLNLQIQWMDSPDSEPLRSKLKQNLKIPFDIGDRVEVNHYKKVRITSVKELPKGWEYTGDVINSPISLKFDSFDITRHSID